MYSCFSFKAKCMCMFAWCVCVHVCDHLSVGSNELHPWRRLEWKLGQEKKQREWKTENWKERPETIQQPVHWRPLCTSSFIVTINPILDQIFEEVEKLNNKTFSSFRIFPVCASFALYYWSAAANWQRIQKASRSLSRCASEDLFWLESLKLNECLCRFAEWRQKILAVCLSLILNRETSRT